MPGSAGPPAPESVKPPSARQWDGAELTRPMALAHDEPQLAHRTVGCAFLPQATTSSHAPPLEWMTTCTQPFHTTHERPPPQS